MKKKKYKLDELLKGINDKNLHKEICTGKDVGKEWPKDESEIPSNEEYQKACKRLEEIIDIVNNDTPEGAPHYQELDKVSYIIEVFEEKYCSLDSPIIDYKEFNGTVCYCQSDKYYYGMVLNIDSCIITYEGKTQVQLEKNFRSAVDNYLNQKGETEFTY